MADVNLLIDTGIGSTPNYIKDAGTPQQTSAMSY
jgi:hypothetical protein